MQDEIVLSNSISIKNIRKEYGHLSAPTIIAFDLDKTVHDIIEHYETLVNQTRIFMGLSPWRDNEFREFHQDGFVSNTISFAKMFPGNDRQALEYYYNIFHNTPVPKDKVLPGVSFMLQRFKYIYKLKIIGVTNSEQHMAKKALRDIGIFDFFDSVTGPKGNRKLKPETELLLIGLNKIGMYPSKKVWFIGDSATDTKCAQDAHCTAIRFYYLSSPKPEDPNADAYCNCHYKFERIVGTLLGYYK